MHFPLRTPPDAGLRRHASRSVTRTRHVMMLVFAGVVAVFATIAAPARAAIAASSATATAAASSSTSLDNPVIQVRQTPHGGQLYDVRTGRRFIPRGSNYIRLSSQTAFHDTFDVGQYDQQQAETALSEMHQLGYNTVRVWINPLVLPGGVGSAGGGLSAAYLANFVNFLQLAWADSIFTIPVLDYVPQQGGYVPQTIPPEFGSNNALYLYGQYVQAKARYAHDFVTGLMALHAPLRDILGYELENEQYYMINEAPLSLTSGTVTTGDSRTYNMASQASRNAMMDNNLVYWFDAVRSAIRAVQPNALVTVSFFAPYYREYFDPADTRLVRPAAIINRSAADFLDLHLYPAWGGTVEQQLDTFGVKRLTKPLIMGEFGSFKPPNGVAQATVQEAAQELQSWEASSCSTTQGYFQGWLVWTWDGALAGTDDLQGTILWNMADANFTIADALAPKYYPNPCTF